jgi:pilus assembly protein Flp/PilA
MKLVRKISVRQAWTRFVGDDNGTTAIEYGIIATMVAVACLGAFKLLGSTNNGSWSAMTQKATAAMQ